MLLLFQRRGALKSIGQHIAVISSLKIWLFSSILGFCHDEISQNPVGEVISWTAILKILNEIVTEYLKKKKGKKIIALAIL